MTIDKDKKIKNQKIALILISVVLFLALIAFLKLSIELNFYANNLKEGYNKCDLFCDSTGESFLLYDNLNGGCQCYDVTEEPTTFINVKAGYNENEQINQY